MRRNKTLIAAAWALTGITHAAAACLSDMQVTELVDKYMHKTPAANPEGLSNADGVCTRAKVNALFGQLLGRVVGYKAGLTNPAVQKRFNAAEPVWGKLYEGMVLDDGASVPAAFGARPLFEADMLVRVKSKAINRARTPVDVLDAIDQIIPFIELPDLVVLAPPKLNSAAVSAINAGARLGVAGKPIAVPVTRGERYAMLDALRDMTVVLTDGSGTELGRGNGSDILDHPLNAVVWLATALTREGLAMQPGELISLGSFSPLLPPKPGQKVTVTYYGLFGAPQVSVVFR